MKVYNRYILTVASLLMAVTVLLAALGQESIEVYYVVYILGALVVTEAFVYLNPQARRGLNAAGVALFAGFMIIIIQQIVAALV